MKTLLPFLIALVLIGCGNDEVTVSPPPPRTYLIPDTSNLTAKDFDYKYYARKKALIKQLNIRSLENDSSRSDVRLWVMSANTNPQKVYLLKSRDDFWTVSCLNYYINAHNLNKVDSIGMELVYQTPVSPEGMKALNIDRVWNLPSQGEMENSGSFGCADGNALLLEMSDKRRYKFAAYICPDIIASRDTSFQVVDYFLYKIKALINSAAAPDP